MNRNLRVGIPYMVDATTSYPRPDNYHYWFSFMQYFLPQADRIEIHCWKEEVERIDELYSIQADGEVVQDGDLTILKSGVNSKVSEYLLLNSLTTKGDLKWFTINLIKNNEHIYHSSHWGTELVIPNCSQEIRDVVRNKLPQDTNIFEY